MTFPLPEEKTVTTVIDGTTYLVHRKFKPDATETVEQVLRRLILQAAQKEAEKITRNMALLPSASEVTSQPTKMEEVRQ